MEVRQIAKELLHYLGGASNLESAAHCATRLRLVVKDMDKVDVKAIEAVEDVKGTFSADGQFQIILGSGLVNKVYSHMLKEGQMEAATTGDVKRAAMQKLNPVQRLARTLSNVFVPIIPAIVASGLLMGLLSMCKTFHWVEGNSGVVTILDMFSNAAFIFLPVLIAFSAAKEFDANPYLAVALGGIMIHPALQNAWTLGDGIEKSIDIFGLSIGMVGYQGTVLPVLLAVWIMGMIERNIRKVVPDFLDIIVTPFITILVAGFITLVAIGPFGRLLGSGISSALSLIYDHGGAAAGLIFGGIYSTIVITGVHHSFHAIEAELIKNVGVNFLLPIWSMANVAQGGAAVAVYFKTKDEKIKSIAIPAATSCLLGITEAAIFGVNLRLVRPFIAAAIGGAIGGAYVVFMKVGMTAVGLTGIPGISIIQPTGVINYIIGMILAFGGAFAFTYLLGFKKGDSSNKNDHMEAISDQPKGKFNL